MALQDLLIRDPMYFLNRYAILSRGGEPIRAFGIKPIDAPPSASFATTDLATTASGSIQRTAITGMLNKGSQPKVPRLDIVRAVFSKSDCVPGGNAKAVFDIGFSSENIAFSFDAYYLPFEPNKSKRLVLGAGADLMFTAHMTGCTFAVGSKVATGEVLVAHANAAGLAETTGDDDEAAIKQSASQAFMVYKKMDVTQPMEIVGPNKYKQDGRQDQTELDRCLTRTTSGATIVGVRRNNVWEFYMQRRSGDPRVGTYVLRDVIKIA